MSLLSSVGARRFILRRGAAVVAAALVSGGKGGADVPGHIPSVSNSVGQSAVPQVDPESSQRGDFAEVFCKQRRELERQQYLRYRAWNNQDADLEVLASTSRAWRQAVMKDRIKAEITVADAIQDKIDSIWQKPLSWVTQQVGEWLKEPK